MYSLRVNLALVLLIVLTATFEIVRSERDFPGAIELVGFSSRRARMSEEPFGDTKYITPPLKKEKADIETVKQNIEAYNRLLKVDTNKLSDQQKDMLERIVERVARLKAALDPAASNKTDNPSNSAEITAAMDATTTTPIIPTTLIATASSLSTTKATPLSSSTTTTTTTTTTSTTIKPTTKSDLTEARANNNNLSPSIGSNRVVSKSKVRQSTTPKPSSSSKATTKRTTGHHHRVSSMKPAAVSSVSTATTNTGPRSTPVTTIQPHQIKQYTKLQNQDIGHDDLAEEKTLPGGNDLSPSAGSIVSDLIYDSNGTASSIIDSLANHAREDYYTRGPLSESTKEKKPTATAKPTKYHYYPHNQHIYLLPECAIQQVCNAVYVRLNYTQPLCACPSRYRDPCSASLNEDDQHTTKLIGNSKKKAITLAKTCEATTEMRECRSPKDWSLLALQNTRTGKSHYLVICRCPDHFKLEGPMAHDQPTYASVPGIRVFGMMCVKPGFSVRKPSVQPPKRYQLQKPFYMPTSNKYTTNKDSRPSYQDDSYQTQHQANYQYLNRPDSSPIITTSNTQDFSDSLSLNNFGGIYGRNNERKGENVEAVTETEGSTISSSVESTTSKDHKRERRSVNDDDDIPPFPWHRLEEFQQSVAWN